MAYSTLVNLKSYMPEHMIVQLTDDYNTNTIEQEIIDDAINQADVLIDVYLRGRYPAAIDEADVPAFIQDISTKLTAYNLYRRKLSLTMPDAIMNDYKTCMSILKDIQSGKMTPFEVVNEPTVVKSNKTSTSRTYNTTVLNSYNTIH